MSARIRIVALAASAAISAAGLNAAAQSMPNITAPKTAATNAAAATNSHIQAEQNTGAPPEQEEQKPQEGISVATTRSPTLTRVTPAPTAPTIPAASWPETAGRAPPQAPSQ